MKWEWIDHYENFPVASLLCPPRLRPADRRRSTGSRAPPTTSPTRATPRPSERLAELAAYRADLHAVMRRAASTRRPLARGVRPAGHGDRRASACRSPLLSDLLSAFEQDVIDSTRYADRAELLDYCRRSANPVGRLLLHLYGVRRAAQALARSPTRSAPRCSSINFWQDLGVDIARGRLYVPDRRLPRHGVDPRRAAARRAGARRARALVAEMVAWTRELMLRGAPLVHARARAAPAGSCAWWCRAACASSSKIERRRLRRRSQRAPDGCGVDDAPLDRSGARCG